MTDTLHPRPRLTRQRWFDLCGTWDFAYDDDNLGLDGRWFEQPEKFDRQIQVPFPPESELSGINDKGYHPVVWYRRTFPAVQEEGERLILHFGAVDYSARVWVNGQLVATHEGGHTPFSADITTALGEGEQVVVVRAEDRPLDGTMPRGKQDWEPTPHAIWYDRTTGIWQPVWLEPVPATYLTSFHLTPDLTRNAVTVEARLNHGHQGWLSVTLRKGDELLAVQQVFVGGDNAESTITIPRAKNGQRRGDLYWSPENPNIITVAAVLLSESGDQIDTVQSYFGLRSVGIGEGRFLLNDKPYFVRSVLEQGFWPQSHLAAPSADALRREVELIKALGFNACRIHQKIEDPRFLYWADHLGLLVWGEMANAYEFNASAVERLTREWLSAVDRDRSNPSIVTWVPINESWGVEDIARNPAQQAYASSLYFLTKALDPTRPVISNEGWEHTFSDIIGVHDYTQHGSQLTDRFGSKEAIEATLGTFKPNRKRQRLFEDDRDQPVMLTEFGGISFHPAAGQNWMGYATVGSEEEYLGILRDLFSAIYASPELSGFCYTQITDTQQEKNGLYDEHRNPKLPVDALREIIWQPSNAVPTEYLDIARRKAIELSKASK
ncbi:glycoside hydrolase family 2 TIM barrel-domain containing protein [Devosia sp. ZB163]|uniref:glycoside hydrolase family 2 protein n=1 Tax=Devosia sp. ZB163 TaxID=3025938 RepID=UPI00235E7D46|nr:sugar-binding domain-containing protein [Devosia sp. ZB163]MDC9823771.1 glycoside hydrolase family 2 TIM barrel-domain containing protein [Devosia sp. ZB163]